CGFGELTGIDLPGESQGRFPAADSMAAQSTAAQSTAAKAERRPPHRGDAESLAIGQGTFTATPLQVVRMMAAIGNNGKLVTPHVVEQYGPASGSSDPSVAIEPIDVDLWRP